MGRFFLLILVLKTLSKINILIQEVLFDDMSIPYYEIKNGIDDTQKSYYTKFCQWSGGVNIFTSFLSQFYCLWLAVLIKQILKDPIHRLNRYIYTYHIITILISLGMTFMIKAANNFGVEVNNSMLLIIYYLCHFTFYVDPS